MNGEDFQPVHTLVAAWAARRPDAVALRFGSVEVCYADLDNRANRLAHRLLTAGVAPGTVVGVLLERSPDAVVAALAVLKAGAAYTMLDPEFPPMRLCAVLAATAASAVVTTSRAVEALAGPTQPTTILLDAREDADAVRSAVAAAAFPASLPDVHAPDPACVMFTSGSTGRPKGVLAPHRALSRMAVSRQYADIRPGDAVLQASQVSWDVYAQELWGALANGAACVLQPGQRPTPERIAEIVAYDGVTVMYAAASLFNHLLDTHPAVFTRLRQVMTGGEPLSAEHVRRALELNPELRVVNGYGPVETMVLSTYHPVSDADAERGRMPIGRAVEGDSVRLLDAGLRPVAAGAVGEVYISGDGLADGYLAQPARTAERFVADPSGAPGRRMYRTGDLARADADGVLEYLGRSDEQVKIRGMRIEPGEIEAVLAGHPALERCAVVVREDVPDAKQLVAYVVGVAGADRVDPADLRAYCLDRLPDHMVPAAFVPVSKISLTANGKLDRASLPAPRAAISGRPPESELEIAVAEEFAAVLGPARSVPLGADDDFFALGGHSLTATQLIGRLRSRFGRELVLRDIFRAPTVAGVAARLETAPAAARPPIAPRERGAVVQLAAAQRRLWFLNDTEPSAAYNLPILIRLHGSLDTATLDGTVRDVVRRHEVLRTTFPIVDGEPRQVIGTKATGLTQGVGTPEQSWCRPFDLRTEPPLRAELFTDGPNEHTLLLVVHHIAADGWSLRPLLRDLGAAYAARIEGTEPDWPCMPVQYADFALWQNDLLAGVPPELSASQLAYWHDALAGAPPELSLPTGRRPGPAPAVAADVVTARLGAGAAIAALAREHDATPFMVLQAALSALLTRLGAGTDIPLGTVTAGRADPALDEVVGFFANTVVLRTDTAGDPTFAELLHRVRNNQLAAFAHQDVPFDLVVSRLNPERVDGRHPLFQTMLVLQNNLTAALTLPGLSAELGTPRTGVLRADLLFEVSEGGEGYVVDLEYATDRFDRGTAEFLLGAFLRILSTAEANRRLSTLPILTAADRVRALESWNATTGPVAKSTMLDFFAAQVATGPDAVAVACGDTALSYGELDTRADRLAGRLRSAGVGADVPVAVMVPRTADIAVAFWGVLKSGGAYLPLDPGNPPARNQFTAEDAGARAVVTVAECAQAARELGLATVVLNSAAPEAPIVENSDRVRPTNPASPAALNDLAYLIYTSGSTGVPKGVALEHRGLANFATTLRDRFGLGPGDRVLLWASVTFDASVWDMALCWASGAALHIAREHERVGADLARLIADAGITAALITPAALATLPDQPLPGLRLLVSGGEACDPKLVRRFGVGRRFVNAYGPSEATVATAAGEQAPDGPVDVGRPLPNTRIYVLDNGLEPLPPNVVGEVYLAGVQLARGYIGRPGQTAERFVADPHGPTPGTRMYRTGDLGRFTPDGRLEITGRTDSQVKIRGFRVELGEIEAALSSCPGVDRAAALLHGDGGQARLVAYLSPADAPDDRTLTAVLRGRLPSYMVPSLYVRLAEIPTTAAGKTNRRALPAPEETERVGRARYTAAATPAEQTVARIWAEVLGVAKVGRYDSFFELGGDSLKSVRIAAGLTAALGRRVGAVEVMRFPTVEALAAFLDPQSQASEPIVAISRQPRCRTTDQNRS